MRGSFRKPSVFEKYYWILSADRADFLKAFVDCIRVLFTQDSNPFRSVFHE